MILLDIYNNINKVGNFQLEGLRQEKGQRYLICIMVKSNDLEKSLVAKYGIPVLAF